MTNKYMTGAELLAEAERLGLQFNADDLRRMAEVNDWDWEFIPMEEHKARVHQLMCEEQETSAIGHEFRRRGDQYRARALALVKQTRRLRAAYVRAALRCFLVRDDLEVAMREIAELRGNK